MFCSLRQILLMLYMKNSLLVKMKDQLQLPRESPQVRNSDGTQEQASGGYFKPKPFYTTSRCSHSNSATVSTCFPEADFKLSLTGNWRYAVQF